MLGAVIGDIAGTFYHLDESNLNNLQFFNDHCALTDDSVMTFAVAEALLNGAKPDDFIEAMGKYKKLYTDEKGTVITEWGNGVAARVSPCGWFAGSLDEAEELAERFARTTHIHPDDIQGAKAVSAAIYMARTRKRKSDIKNYIDSKYGYHLDCIIDDIRPRYPWNLSDRDPVAEAFVVVFESSRFEGAIINALSLGGRRDKICAITGSLAEAFYGIPSHLVKEVYKFLDAEMETLIMSWIDSGKPLSFAQSRQSARKQAVKDKLRAISKSSWDRIKEAGNYISHQSARKQAVKDKLRAISKSSLDRILEAGSQIKWNE